MSEVAAPPRLPFLERAIAAVSPRMALARQRDRMLMANMSGYEAAKNNRSGLRNYNPRARTADEDTLPRLETIRARSREMMMNAPLAGGAIRTVVTNVVGTGLVPSPQPSRKPLASAGVTDAQIEAFEDAAKSEWAAFTAGTTADTHGKLTFAMMQDLAFRSTLVSGDCFVAVVRASDGPFAFALQLMEADRVSNPHRRPDSDTLAGGIEFIDGRPSICHVAELPRMGQGKTTWRPMAMRAQDGSPRMIHVHRPDRIDQTRGVPYLAPVMGLLKDLERYSDAEITAAVLGACIAIMGESATGESPLAKAAGVATTDEKGLRKANIDFEPGMVLEGFMPGEKLESFATERPNMGFDPFVMAILRQIGVALELPLEILIKHFTSSYSAARAALLEAVRFFMVRRAWLASVMCQPIYELVITNAVLAGRIQAPGLLTDPFLRIHWCTAEWTGPSPGQIDPMREVQAAERRIDLLISTRAEETAALTGGDFEAKVAQRAREDALIKANGLVPGVAATPPPADPLPN